MSLSSILAAGLAQEEYEPLLANHSSSSSYSSLARKEEEEAIELTAACTAEEEPGSPPTINNNTASSATAATAEEKKKKAKKSRAHNNNKKNKKTTAVDKKPPQTTVDDVTQEEEEDDGEPKPKNGFADTPYWEKNKNNMPEYPDLYADHPKAERLPRNECNKLLKDTTPVGVGDLPWSVFFMLSPMKQIKTTEMFEFEEYARAWPLLTVFQTLHTALSFFAQKHGLNQAEVMKDFDMIVDVEMENLLQFGAEHSFEHFKQTYKQELEEKFKQHFGFQPTSLAIKHVGAFPSFQKAREFILSSRDYRESKFLKAFTGESGKWLMFDPAEKDVENQEYVRQEVAQLMRQANRNGAKRQSYFEKRMASRIYKEYQRNKEIAERTGQKLTMHVNEQGKITESMRDKVHAELDQREAKPTAPRSAETSAAGASRIESVQQFIEKTDLATGKTTVEEYQGVKPEFNSF